jgi:enoyl-[acyl-carrier-protein] reductase (NADH)
VAMINANVTPDLLQSVEGFSPDVRVNGLQLSDGVEPDRVAEAVAFLVSPRSTGIHGAILPIA